MQTLAHRYLSKAAKDIPEFDGNISMAGRHIITYEDRALMLRVCRAQARYGEAADMIADQQTGLWTLPPREKWEFATQYMDFQALNEDWAGLWDTCVVILEESRSTFSGVLQYDFGRLGDDWKTWETLVRANNYKTTGLVNNLSSVFSLQGLTCSSISSRLEDFIRSYFGEVKRTDGRNARLALLLFYTVELFEGRKTQNDLVTIFSDYFRDFSVKTACFLDLQPWLLYLDEAGQKQLLINAAKVCHDIKPVPENPQVSSFGPLEIQRFPCH